MTVRTMFSACLAALSLVSSCDVARPPRAVVVQPQPAHSPSAASPSAADRPPETGWVQVRILAFNDFHGALEPPAGSNGRVLAPADGPTASEGARKGAGRSVVVTGGAAYLATHIARLRAESANAIVVSAGDLTGASPLVSSLFDDEPTVLVMNRLGLDIEAVGNHDFDRGLPALRRLRQGGCATVPCDAGARGTGAAFEYLAANVFDRDAGRPLFAPYVVRDFGAARVAFIGETLVQTPLMTAPSIAHDLIFRDEAETANALVPELQRVGASAIVLLLHQGARQASGGTYDSCQDLSGDLLPILGRLSPAIDVVVSAHTHQAYDCMIDGRLVTSAASYGRLVTKIDLTIDPARRRVVEKHAQNVPVTHEVPPDGPVSRIVAEYEARARPIAERVVGYVERDITSSARTPGNPSCETPLGDLIADAMQVATGADIALMNPGGVRADLVARRPDREPFVVTYADAFEVQPFQNRIIVLTLTGAEILAALARQFGPRSEPRILQVSRGFSYRYAYDRARRSGTIAAVNLDGKPIRADGTYRVVVPSFLAGGGDSFDVFASVEGRTTGPLDVDALAAYLGKTSSPKAPLVWRPEPRITGDGCR